MAALLGVLKVILEINPRSGSRLPVKKIMRVNPFSGITLQDELRTSLRALLRAIMFTPVTP